MRGHEPVIAAIRFDFFCDHFVTIFEVKDSTVIIGDPLVGRVELTFSQFQQTWRRYGIVLDRKGASFP